MAYKFKAGKLPKSAVRRIAREQVARALAALAHDPVRPQDVHECRKVVKRLRALLRLIEPNLPPKVFRALYKDIGKTGDLLAGTRDLHVMRETAANLQAASGPEAQAVLAPLRAALDRKAQDATETDAAALEEARLAFVAEAGKFQKLAVARTGFSAIREGLETTYRDARRHTKRAWANPGDEAFHELRKRVQWHWRHMALISRTWPDYFEARVAACQMLGEQLGEDHDLSVLAAAASDLGADAGIDSAAVSALVVARQADLRTSAHALAVRLFAEKPAAFATRMKAYWSAPAMAAPPDSEPAK